MSRELDIRRALGLPPEYALRRLASGHYEVVCPDGSLLRMPNGMPVKLSFSPGPNTSRRNERSRLRRALAATDEERHTPAPTECERPAGASLSTSATKETRPDESGGAS